VKTGSYIPEQPIGPNNITPLSFAPD